MSEIDRPASRRDLLRRRTLEEIKERAFELLDAGGTQDVTIASVGKGMGMTPPALYRYFPSREALVGALVADAYADLGSAVAGAVERAADEPARERVHRALTAYRAWALDHPRRYTMLFSDRSRDVPDTADGVAALNVGMLSLLAALGEVAADAPDPSGAQPTAALDEAFARWAQGVGAPGGLAPETLRLAVLAWSRVHGFVSLEITGALDAMGLDARSLVESEIEALLDEAGAGAPGR